MVVKTIQNFLFQKPVHNPYFKAKKFLVQMKRFATPNHQNLLENLSKTELWIIWASEKYGHFETTKRCLE